MNRAAMLTAGTAGVLATAGTVAYVRRPRTVPLAPGVQRLIDGAMIHYVEEGSGPAVILIHGFGASTFSWRDVAPMVADHFRVVALDLPGFGYSSRDASLDLGHAAQAERVVHLMDELGIDRAILAGHSMGGGIAQRIAMTYPERVAGLVLVAATDPLDPSRFARGQRRARIMVPLATLLLHVTPASRLAVRRGLASMMGPRSIVTNEMADGYRLPLAVHGTGAVLLKMLDDVVAEPPPNPAAISVPCIVLSGGYDTVIGAQVGERLARRVPGAGYRLIEDSGHMLTDEHPEEVASAIRWVAGRVSSE